MRNPIALVIGLALALAAKPTHAEAVVLEPTSPWNVDFGEKSCRVTRFFGAADSRHVLVIHQYWPDRYFGLSLAGPHYAGLGTQAEVSLRFFDGQAPIAVQPMTGTIEGFGSARFYRRIGIATEDQPPPGPQPVVTRFPTLDIEIAGKVAFVALSAADAEIRLTTGPLEDVFEVLNQCASDLAASWGLDVKRHRTATRLPKWVNEERMARTFLDSAIPFARIPPGSRGTIRLRVIVDEAGKVGECAVIEAPDIDLVERPLCRAMGKAQFEPALDAAAQPMRSFYATTITYEVG